MKFSPSTLTGYFLRGHTKKGNGESGCQWQLPLDHPTRHMQTQTAKRQQAKAQESTQIPKGSNKTHSKKNYQAIELWGKASLTVSSMAADAQLKKRNTEASGTTPTSTPHLKN